MQNKNNIKILPKYIKKYLLYYFIGFIALIGVDWIQLKIPLITGNLTDKLKDKVITTDKLIEELMILLVIGIFITLGRFVWRYFIFGTSRKIEYNLRNDFFAHLEKLSLSYYNKNKTGDLMAYATNDLNAIRMMIGPGVLMALDAIALTVLVIYQMITKISLSLTLFAILPLPIIAIGSLFLGKNIRSRFKDKQEAFAHMSDMVQENISGIRVIKSFVQESKEIIAFNKINKDTFNKNMRVVKLQAIMMPLSMLIGGISISLVLGYGGYLSIVGKISLGSLVSFIQYLLMLVWPMIAFGWCINIMSQGLASLNRFEDILNEKPEIVDKPNLINVKEIKGKIEVKNLSFSYDNSENYVLKNLSFSIEKGQTIGIVGRTGSGKTTLVNLLLRLFNPPEGTIYIDGYEIYEIPLYILRNSIAYVPQENFLFSDTIANNIAFSKKEADIGEIIDAAKKADVNDNIMEFPNKYETIVGERGVTLSGGQKQRVSIARALLKNSPIMILDDSVSAVDTKTEERILSHLKSTRKNKTTIIIAHRISTIQNADLILVLDNGEIVEQGNHKSLLNLKGLYYDMFEKQQLEKEIADEE